MNNIYIYIYIYIYRIDCSVKGIFIDISKVILEWFIHHYSQFYCMERSWKCSTDIQFLNCNGLRRYA